MEITVFLLIVAGVGFYFYKNKPQKEVIIPLAQVNINAPNLDKATIDSFVYKVKQNADNLAVKPTSTEALTEYYNEWIDLGVNKKALGDFKGAEAAWLAAIETNANGFVPFANLGDLYANFLKDNVKAEENYKKAIAVNPSMIYIYRNLADLYRYNFKDTAKTEEILLAGIEANKEIYSVVELYVYLGSYFAELGDKVKALKYFQEALKIEPDKEAIKEEIKNLQ